MHIYLAGLEQHDGTPFIEGDAIVNAFISYYYVRSRGNSKRMPSIRKKVKRVIVDSGTHSFFAETSKALSASVVVKKHKTKETPEIYFQEYKKWIKDNWDYFDYYVELDIGEITGQKKVLAWREELKKEKLFKKCITVVHPGVVSFKDFQQMMLDSESKYLALEGDRPNRQRLPYNRWLKPAYEKGIKIHGFAMTKMDALKKYPFASVDSTSWKAGIEYGIGKVLTDRGLENIRFKDQKNCIRIKNINHKVHSLNKAENRFYRCMVSIKAYQKMEQYYTNLWKVRGVNWK